MALTSWKSFRFFDVAAVNHGSESDANSLFTQGEVTCIESGHDALYAASPDGNVHILSRSFKIARSFKAHEGGSINHMKPISRMSLLVTVAEDLSSEPTLKVWALDKPEKKTGFPRCLSTLKIQHGRTHFPITAFAALSDLSQLAFGFGNGAVTVVRGDLVHDRGARQRTVFESEEPITGIAFREGNTTALYISTTSRILTLVISGRGQGQPARVLDDVGCDIDCMTVDESNGEIIVARDDAIYHYGLHGRGSCYNCDGHKTILKTHKDYIVMACPSSTTTISRSTLSTLGPNRTLDASERSSTLTILNTDFHFIAYTEAFASQVQRCFTVWGELFVTTLDGKVFRYREKSLQERVDLILHRNLYVLAIQVAQKAGVTASQQNSIFRKYGDYLYQKKDYDTAMQQYLRAIDNAEPSHIIRKFLGTQRIYNLIDYLEELHEASRANSDHTVLLLNCYAKTKDIGKLENFIKAPGDLKFDLDTAISMCRQGGYFDQAAYLARKHSEHDMVISILIEDLHKYAEALAYIWRLEPKLAYGNMMRYATVLLSHCPDDATQFLVDYYTGQFVPKQDAFLVTDSSKSQQQTGGTSNFASSAVQSLASLIPLPYIPTGGAPISNRDHTQKNGDSKDQDEMQPQVIESTPTQEPSRYEVPKPRTAFSAFVDHPLEFMEFLEACVKFQDLSEDDKTDLYTTLFEMYIRRANEEQGDERLKWQGKAKVLVESKGIPIDPSNVLLLSNLNHFPAGTTLVREQQNLYLDIFRSYTSAKDVAEALKSLKKYGSKEPQLYPAALAFFTSSPEILGEVGEQEVEKLLIKIDTEKIMAPLQVIQTLSKNDVATMGLVKKYLNEVVERERKEIGRNSRTIETFRKDTSDKRHQLDELMQNATTFKATRCNSCGYALEQPMVHFLCQHSFHQRCLNVPEGQSLESIDCPNCAAQNSTVRAIKQAQDENKEKHEVFKEALGRSRDGFGTVADWFGRGVMDVGGSG